jgi:hypothetical protein
MEHVVTSNNIMTHADRNNILNISVRIGDISMASSFSTRGMMLSGPAAL